MNKNLNPFLVLFILTVLSTVALYAIFLRNMYELSQFTQQNHLWIIVTFALIIFNLTIFVMLFLFDKVFFLLNMILFKKDFINSLIHEMKSHLSSIVAGVDMLKNEQVYMCKGTVLKYLTLMDKELQYENSLIHRVLTLARLEDNRISLNKVCISLIETLNDIEERYKIFFKKVCFTNDIKISNIYADDNCFREIIQNLFDNSIKYSNGKVHIHVSAFHNGKQDIIKIKDNGIGISPQEQAFVFNRFSRSKWWERNNIVKGYGLGLFYAKRIIQEHGGDISLESKEGQYTIFVLKFPSREF